MTEIHTWDEMPEELANLLYELYKGSPEDSGHPTVPKIQEWIGDHMSSCAAETFAGVRYYPDGSGQPPEYCEEIAAPGSEFCRDHVDERD